MLGQPFVVAVHEVVAHVLGEPAGLGRLTDGLCDLPDQHGRGAAADAEVVDAEVVRRLGEGADLIAVGVERVQCGREGAAVRRGHSCAVVAEVEERRFLGGRAVGDRQRADVAGHGRADLLEPGQHRLGSAEAVHAHHRRAGLLQPLAGFDDADPLGHLLHRHRRDGEDDGQVGGLRDLERRQRLAGVIERLADDHVGAVFDSPAHHLLEHAAYLGLAGGVLGVPDVGVRDVAGHEVAGSLVGDLPGDLQCGAVERLEQVFLADDPHLLAVTVVGERLDDVRAGALVVDVKGPEGVRVLQGDLGDELTGAEVATALQFEQEALGADHRPGVQACGRSALGVSGVDSVMTLLDRGGRVVPRVMRELGRRQRRCDASRTAPTSRYCIAAASLATEREAVQRDVAASAAAA